MNRWNEVARFFVAGLPRPGGSKTATVIRRKGGAIVFKNGRPLITTRDDAKGNAEWKQTVSYAVRQEFRGDPFAGTLGLAVLFVMPRLKSHYGSGRNEGKLKADAPLFHTVKPDATKLLRAMEDALSGILITDDNRIAEQWVRKVYGDRPGAHIWLYQCPDNVREVERLAPNWSDSMPLFQEVPS